MANGASAPPAQPVPKTVQQDGMYGEATVDLGDSDYLKLGANGGAEGGPGGLPKNDSWLDLKQGGKEKRGMHVTFSVRLFLAVMLIGLHADSPLRLLSMD